MLAGHGAHVPSQPADSSERGSAWFFTGFGNRTSRRFKSCRSDSAAKCRTRLRSSAEEHLASNQTVVGSTPTGDSLGEWCQRKHVCLARRNSRFESELLPPTASVRRTSCPDRLLVRILGFQPGGQSSILCRGTRIASIARRSPQPRLFSASLRKRSGVFSAVGRGLSEVTQLAECLVVTQEVGGSIPPFGAIPHYRGTTASLAKLENAAGLDPVVARLVGSTPTGSTNNSLTRRNASNEIALSLATAGDWECGE